MATHSSVLAWRIPGTGEPGGLPMGSHRVRYDWSNLAAAGGTKAAFSWQSFEYSIKWVRIQGFLLWRVETTIPGPGGTLSIGPRVSVWWFFPHPWVMSSLICTDHLKTPREPLTPLPSSISVQPSSLWDHTLQTLSVLTFQWGLPEFLCLMLLLWLLLQGFSWGNHRAYLQYFSFLGSLSCAAWCPRSGKCCLTFSFYGFTLV